MQNIAKSWQKYQQSGSRTDLNNCLVEVYFWGKKICHYRYWEMSSRTYSEDDILHWALLKLTDYIRKSHINDERHLLALFNLLCKRFALNYWRQETRTLSLNAPLKTGETITLEEFIASKLLYCTPEENEVVEQINSVISSFKESDRALIESVWMGGETLKDASARTGKTITAIEKVLFKAKGQILKQLINKKVI